MSGQPMITADGTKEWYINGKRVASALQFRRLASLTEDQLALPVLNYGDVC